MCRYQCILGEGQGEGSRCSCPVFALTPALAQRERGLARPYPTPSKSAPASTVQLVRFLVAEPARSNETILKLLAVRVEVDAARGFAAAGADVHHVGVEDEARIAGRLEPVDVVPVIGDGRTLTRHEFSIDRGLDDEMVFLVLEAV